MTRWTAVLLPAVVAGCGGDDDAPASKPPAALTVGRLICTGSGSPTVVLESGLGVEPRSTWGAVAPDGISFDPGGDPDPALERAWGRMQRELAARSPEGTLIVAKRSHHRIAEDQPELVVRAIEQVSG